MVGAPLTFESLGVEKSNNADASVHKVHISAYQPATSPIVPMSRDDKATLAMASAPELEVTVQSSASDFFSSNYNRIQVPLTWQRAISGGVLMGFGILLCLFGFLSLRFSLLLTGFIGGAIAAYAILLNTEPDGLWSNRILIYVAVCIAAGLLVGMIMLGLNKYATWILGGAGGLALGVYILSWRAGGLIHNTAGRIALMAGPAALGMFLSIFLGKLTSIFATVLIGGYMFTLGLDMFLRTGFLENYKQLFRTGNNVPYQMYSGIYGMLGVLSLAFLLGFLFQIPLYFLHRRKQRRHDVPVVKGPYGTSNRDNQYGGSQYGSQYGGSQYGSRDHLGVPQNQGAPAEYTWYGKRKNPPVPANNPYNHGYNEKGYQPVYSQNNLNQPTHGAPVAAPSSQAGPVVPSTSQNQAANISDVPSTTTGDKTVAFEEKKNWLGRTKVVPKFTDNAISSTATANADTTATATQPPL
ncbi:hypothetical protein KI688_000013 [Linnemannia hyalina]|uniref:Transmembrane protein 198 n=1 Tax=Linnemannia hyalina TaxID=64524 RepID=A0A9P7Y2P6_9FUNG|nr:hypothetical protein KI688_000013 [Linnemannia hyalina]